MEWDGWNVEIQRKQLDMLTAETWLKKWTFLMIGNALVFGKYSSNSNIVSLYCNPYQQTFNSAF